MPASEAQIRANRANAQKSTGPKTPEGKGRSRANAYKHGLAGAGTVLPEREMIEVERRCDAFRGELKPSGEVGEALVRIAATLSVRLERCFEYENAALTARVRQAEAEFVAPDGVDPAEAARLRFEAGKLALFDPSPEAVLARKYEAAAERGFLRALKELRQVERAAKASDRDACGAFSIGDLGSFADMQRLDAEFDALYPEVDPPAPRKGTATPDPIDFSTLSGRVDVPFTIGRRR